MSSQSLASYVRIKRRYSRSINLERDLGRPDALEGYLLTSKVVAFLERISSATSRPGSPRVWSATGVYGTGKSAFAHLLAALHGPASDPGRQRAVELLDAAGLATLGDAYRHLAGGTGFVQAVATARREPVAFTVLRALSSGTEAFWAGRRGKRPAAVEECRARAAAVALGETPRVDDIAELVREIARASRTGVLLIIDELGKNLEQTARTGGADDLYVLQQLAELPNGPDDAPVLIFTTLHQGFAEYGAGLAPSQRAEWDKVQGRFEHVAFAEAPEDMLRLVADAIEADFPEPILSRAVSDAAAWSQRVGTDSDGYLASVLSAERIRSVFPLHPVAALVLPSLCAKYAQNDRSLFTFLSSQEPHSFTRFLAERDASLDTLPLLTLPELYDYFVDTASGAVSRAQFQRWAEVQGLIRDAGNLSVEETAALKTIGALNLVAAGGPLRARRSLVIAALCSTPDDGEETDRWASVLDRLAAQRLVTYRTRVDEYRLWEGSDYDAESTVTLRSETDARSLAVLLEAVAPLTPIVAQRHSTKTGTLRYFERRYFDDPEQLTRVACRSPDSDGLLLYWVGAAPPPDLPRKTTDGRPLALLHGSPPHALVGVARETAALMAIEHDDARLPTDGVARREVRQRLLLARSALDQMLLAAFACARFVSGTWNVKGRGALGSALSDLCDIAYEQSPVLWNEHVNRRELTVQGSQARRRVLEAMLDSTIEQERLGIQGNGPEFSIYSSVLLRTGIHRKVGEEWVIGPPTTDEVLTLWNAVEAFCLDSVSAPRKLDELYRQLALPPYGVKQGVVPVILAAVLLYHADDVSVYRDGTFLPLLGPEHFELLVKDAARFAVKHFALTGLRLDIFKELEDVLRRPVGRLGGRVRNATVLGVIRPLVRFASSLPGVTLKATDLGREALAVRDSLLSETEPDRLLFERLPAALGLAPFGTGSPTNDENHRLTEFRGALFRALRELDGYYERLLGRCGKLIHEAFGVRSDITHLREDLRVRSQYLVGRCVDPMLRRLTHAATATAHTDREWLESIVMIIADRPAEGWTDRDVAKFDLNLSDAATRFARLEALIREAKADGLEGFETRRITITRPDGRETNRLVWFDRAQQGQVAGEAQRIAAELRGLHNEVMRDAIVVALMEKILAPAEPANDAAAAAHERGVSNG
jgi:hypothetical protein